MPEQPARPASVTTAVQAIWAVNAVSALILTLGGDSAQPDSDGMVLSVLILFIYALVTWMVGAGKNWARLTYAFLIALELALLAAFGMDNAADLEVLATYLTTPVEIWALYKLFCPESEPWFKSKARR